MIWSAASTSPMVSVMTPEQCFVSQFLNGPLGRDGDRPLIFGDKGQWPEPGVEVMVATRVPRREIGSKGSFDCPARSRDRQKVYRLSADATPTCACEQRRNARSIESFVKVNIRALICTGKRPSVEPPLSGEKQPAGSWSQYHDAHSR
jgi:hypothetical protein